MEKVIFTDIDGTLLDSRFPDINKMKELVEMTLRNGIHLIFCSSKTELEQNKIKSEVYLHEPYIVENGGATIIPVDYFKKTKINNSRISQNNYIIETGGPAIKIRSLLKKIKDKYDIDFIGVSDISVSELSKITKLSQEYASRMMDRKYSETIVQINNMDFTDFAKIIEKEGLKIIPGNQYFDITIGNDKGTGVSILIDTFREEYANNVIFFGIGDSRNDEPMLTLVDIPMLVQKFDGNWDNLQFDKLHKINGIGSKGWEIALELVLKYQDERP
ncbi:MAG TPA: HAD-IIB family hydrolase [Nitrososphaeraceae archaeon]|nr:HAD-IIB family hydrolase [Nitrososphaeraceae archaeon]